MGSIPTLRRELITAFALVFAGALLVAATGVVLLVPRLETASQSVFYLIALLVADVAIFAIFGRYLLQARLMAPMERMIDEVEAIAAGDYEGRLPETGTQEMGRLAAAVNHMAERLITDQQELTANIRSLDETNQMLTEARDAVVRAEKMASVGRLGAGIAHEIGNPLGAIIGYLGLLRRNADDARRELVVAAEREAQRIDRIVRSLLDYARPREPLAQPVNLNAVLRETLELIEIQGRFNRVDRHVEMESDLPGVRGDRHQLQQVMVNLLVNATDALADVARPSLFVRTRSRAARRPEHRPARRSDDPPGIDYSHRRRFASPGKVPRDDPASPSGRVVELSVTDNGRGIEPALLDQIFEPFVTTKEPGKGTGLGLAVCASIATALGGTVRADSVEGEGSTFTLILPAMESPAIESVS